MSCKHLLALLLLLLAADGFGQNFSNKGREFWVGYGHHQYMEPGCTGNFEAPNDMNMVLYISAEEAAIVKITIDSSGTNFVPVWTRTYNIPAFTVISTDIIPKGSTHAATSGTDPNYDARLFDNPTPLGSGGENLWRKKGIHIESNVPIVAYAHIYGGVSSGATMLMPVNTWGYSYTSVNSEQRDADRSYSWMYIIAKDNNTLVQITPSATSRRGRPAGVPYNVLIQKGQIYQLVGQSECSTGNGPELTGTTVKSLVGPDGKCHPVAVFGGSSRTGGESTTCGSTSGRDNDMQQLFPEHAWGKRFATAPFSKSSGTTLQANQFQTSVYKVVVKDPATIVRRNGVQLTGLIGGKYYRFSSATADYLFADQPVMVAQFMGGGSTPCNGTGQGDPEMVILSPVEQAIKQCSFYRNDQQDINTNYLTLVVPTPGVSSLRIDNSATFNHTYPHPNLPGYTVVVKGWIASPSQALVRCDSSFTAITYGLGGAESYGYNAGTFINNLSAIGAIHNTFDTTNTTNSFTCTRTPVELSVLMAYKPLKMEWRLSTLASKLTPNADVTVNPPVVVDSPLVNGIKYYKYTLPGSYFFSDTGTFTIPIVVTSPSVDNCTQTDSVSYTIIVKGKPVADFTYTHSGCYTDTVFFSGNGTGGNYSINRWRWEFPGPSPDSIRNPKRIFPVGSNTVKLQVISQEGCVGDTVRQVIIAAPPSTDFTITPGSLCEPSTYNFTSATAAGAGVSFYWNLGNGSTSTGNTASATYPTYGTYIIKHLAAQTGQCPSDTVRKTITIFAKPRVNFGYPVGCLALDGTAQFSDSTISPDGQSLTYAWDFGDATNSNVGNPNTSTLKNPSHKYIAFGTYNVKLTVTTSNGCVKDTTIACTFAVRPVLAYAPLTGVCVNNQVVSIARGSSVNGVPGTGFYRGPGTDSAGNFNPAIAGEGIKTIWYVFTSTGGCKDSASQTINVFPKPVAAFTLSDTSFCMNTSTTVTPASTIAGGTIRDWKWDFGSGVVTYTNNNPFVQSFNAPAPYTIRLYNISDSSCVSDTVSRIVNVNAVPVSNFTFTHTGCNLDTVFMSGAGSAGLYTINTWKWNFSNGDSSVLQNPKILLPTGAYSIKLSVGTPQGCFDDTTRTITVFAPPVAGINGSPLSLCEPGTVNFTDGSTYGGTGAFTSSYWDFGNGQTVTNATNSAVSNTYPAYGTYVVRHVVKVSNLCISDTTTKTVTVFAKPRVNFGYPRGCLALDQTAQFSDSTINPDGQALTYAWDFGDATNSNAGNPNTSALRNPSHKYIAFGTYNIKLTVTTGNGCVKDTTIACTFAVRPTLAFAALANVCINIPTVSVAKGTVLNGVPGTGFYRGPGTDTAGNFRPSVAGIGSKTIWYVFTSTGGCADSLSQTITVLPKPVAAFTLSDTSFCMNASTTVTPASTIAGGTIRDWKWDFGSGIVTYANNNPFTQSFNPPAQYTIRLYNISDSSCVSDTVSKIVNVNAVPVSNFSFTHTGCNLDTVFLSGAGSAGLYTINSWKWNFSNGDSSVLQNPKILLPTGSYTIRLSVGTPQGCFDDTTRTITVFAPPVAGVTGSPLSLCEPGTVNFTDGSTYGGTGAFTGSYWDFGNGQVVNNTNTNAVSSIYPVYGTYTVKHVVRVSNLCISDTARQTVTVFAKPRVNFTYPIGCLPLSNIAQFTNATTVPDGQALSYAWTFGDVNATPGNPNTSTATNPTHQYNAFGQYNINLSVTSANGCVKDTTIQVTFNVRPTLAFAPLTSVCVNAVPVSLARGSVTNSVPGTGIYRGPGTDTAGLFNPAIAGTGAQTIWYIFTSNAGCKDSVSQTIRVHPKPVAAFTLSDSVFCANAVTTVRPQATGSVTSYRWDFGDNTNAVYANNSPFTRNFAAGNYTIQLSVVSDSSCVSDTVSKPIVVNPLPKTDFDLPVSICMPAGRAQFTNRSTITSGTLTYTWRFGDLGTSTDKDPLHIYAATGPYPVSLRATSAAGCFSDTTKQLTTFYDQPVALFDVTPDILCQGTSNVFNNRSTAPNSTIKSWSWVFGDGSRSAIRSPIKRFNLPGSYTISLTVESVQGCLSDTFKKTVLVYKQPLVNAGPSFTVMENTLVNFAAIASDSTVRFLWTPGADLSNDAILTPSLIARTNQVYYLTATGEGNCTFTDSLSVKVLRPFTIPNAFSPNGDGVNDTWAITNLADYPGVNVEIYDRYGHQLLRQTGYSKPWDGKYEQTALPIGTYYYVINLRNGTPPRTGSVTIIR